METIPEATVTLKAARSSVSFPAMTWPEHLVADLVIWPGEDAQHVDAAYYPTSWPELSTTGGRLTPRSYISVAASATPAP